MLLPVSAGSYQYAVPLSASTWFRVGGPTDILFKPSNSEGLCQFLKSRPSDLPYTTLGVGSNILVRDGGIRGVVIRLTQGFRSFIIENNDVEIGAGLLDRVIAERCCDAGLGGLEFLYTIPGTLGGALRMNAGAYGTEIKDCLVYAEVMDPQGILHRLTPEEMGYSYRHCALPDNWIFVSARLRGAQETPSAIRKRMNAFAHQRSETQPTHGRTGGSTFANPPQAKAWQLIDAAGCRGLSKGDASVSTKHCNFLINNGKASARDIEELGEEVRMRVHVHSGIELRWEIVRLGELTF